MDERRSSPRRNLRLRIIRVQSPFALDGRDGLSTVNISAGGMYLHCDSAELPQPGMEFSFQLAVPPGVGYSASVGRVDGSGRVVRTDRLSDHRLGLAVQFTDTPLLQF